MSGTDYTQTPSLGLYKPIANRAVGTWGDLWNANADALDSAIHFATGGGPFLPLAGGAVIGPTSFMNAATTNPVAPGYMVSARYGSQLAVDIFAKTLSVPPRNTFNVLEGVLTLPATVTDYNTYHTAIAGFVSNKSSMGVGYGVGSHAVAEADNCLTGTFGGLAVDSPKDATINGPSGIYSGVRLQNEFDWYTNNPGTSVRADLQIGYFLSAPSIQSNNIAFLSNIFVGAFAVGTGYFNTAVSATHSTMTIVPLSPVPTPPLDPVFTSGGPLVAGMHLEGTGIDSTANIIILPFHTIDPMTGIASTGSGGAGTYVISANVGTIGSAGVSANQVVIRATSTYQWNQTFASPDGVSIVALDVGQRNFSASLTLGDRSQFVNWRYTNVAPDTISGTANERIMQQWVEPIVGVTDPLSSPPSLGGVLYIQNYLQQLAPASYGIQNWSFNGASFAAKNHAQTAFVDMLHLDINDRTVVGAGSTRTIIGSGALAFTTLPTNAANDAAAASAGVAVGGVYRNASALMVRVA